MDCETAFQQGPHQHQQNKEKGRWSLGVGGRRGDRLRQTVRRIAEEERKIAKEERGEQIEKVD